MDRPFVLIGTVYIALIILVGIISFLDVGEKPQSCDQGAKYHILVLEKLPTESTGVFFDRTRVTINCLNEQQYIVYSFLPLFDVNTPTIVGATIMYEVKK